MEKQKYSIEQKKKIALNYKITCLKVNVYSLMGSIFPFFIFYHLSKSGSTLKGKHLLRLENFLLELHFRRSLLSRNPNRKLKLFLFVKMAVKLGAQIYT